MKQKLIRDIGNYITYLESLGLYVSVHGKGIGGLLEHNIHRTPFCALIKSDPEAWQKCRTCQLKVFRHHSEEKLFGMCHAGQEEYVYFVNERTFISVSGYGIHREKAMECIRRLSHTYSFAEEELIRVYDKGLRHHCEKSERLDALIFPLCHMLRLLQMMVADTPVRENPTELFDGILAFLERNFMENVSLADVAAGCACSVSTVCHLFKKHTGKTARQYLLSLRITQAQKLLKTSSLPVSHIAQLCGFENAGHFPTAFKKAVGCSPSEYRKKGLYL